MTSDPDDSRSDDANDAQTSRADERTDELQRERDEYLANWQRTTADYQNLRRRLQSDIDAAVARAKRPLHQDLLLVLDYLDMALAASRPGADSRALLDGVQMTRAQLASLLERENIRLVPTNGTFDSAVHEAVERVETDERPAGTILSTLRPGYVLQGQILRPAQVRVAVAPGTGAVDAGVSSRASAAESD
jgi:molecular chaperone GrpE